MLHLAAFAIALRAATIACPEIRLVSAPTMSEWGLVGLGLVVAVAAGISIRCRNRN
jgi:hypothetical protein